MPEAIVAAGRRLDLKPSRADFSALRERAQARVASGVPS
jgi:hypothetical protein